MSPRSHRHRLHVMLSCLFGLLLLAVTWPRPLQSTELSHHASLSHSAAVISDGSRGDLDDDANAVVVIDDNCGMDDILHVPAVVGLGLIPAGSDALASGPYAVRQRDIALLLRPPEAA